MCAKRTRACIRASWLEPLRRRACGEGIARLFEVDAFLAHPVRKLVMLIEADAGGERKIRTDAHEHPSPPPVIDVEVVLHDPSVCDLEMPSIGLAVADCGHDAGGFTRLEDHDDFIRLCSVEVGIDEVIAAALRSFDDWDAPLACPKPSAKLGTARQCPAACSGSLGK